MYMERLPLKLDDGRRILYKDKCLAELVDDVEYALDNMSFLNDLKFAKKVMFSHEIKNNNNIEGINDDMDSIKNVVENNIIIGDRAKQLRIFNLYKGYCYILKHSEINKHSLKELYGILSKDLLEDYEKNNMGEFYRTKQGIILNKGRLDDSYDTTMDPKYVEEFMDSLIEYINSNNTFSTMTQYFIKSMIAHFYFVCIHPYYDLNGRTSRTMSMWYLLNNKCYPYLMFNRAISYEFPNYDEVIKHGKDRADVTNFIKNMLICAKKDIEKEYIIENIKDSINYNLSTNDYQTLHYILTMKGLITLLDFATIYNASNNKKKVIDIFKDLIEPLLDKGVLEVVRYTKKNYVSNKSNFEFKIKDNLIVKDDKILKYIK